MYFHKSFNEKTLKMKLKNLSQIIEAINNNIVLLPHFQREYVWNKTQQKNLILSVLTNLPSSSSLLLKRQEEDNFRCIRIGMRSEVVQSPPSNEAYYLLDGQQRYTTSFYAFNFVYTEKTKQKNEELFKKIDNKLNKIWYLNLIDDNNYLFGFKNLIWDDKETRELLPDDINSFLEFNSIKSSDIKPGNEMLTDVIKTCNEDKNKPMIPLFMLKGHDKLGQLLQTFFDNRLNEIKLHNDNSEFLIEILTKTEFKKGNIKLIKKEVNKYYTGNQNIIDEIDTHLAVNANLKFDWTSGVRNFFEKQINNYEILPIMMEDRNKAVKTFEYINRGGTNLNSFDLLCAKVPNFDLRAKVINITKQPFVWFDRNGTTNNDFVLTDAFGLLGDKNEQPSIEKKYAEYLSQALNLIHWKEDGKYPDNKEFNTQILKSSYSLDKLDENFITKNYESAVEIVKKSAALLQVFAGHGYLKNITNNLSMIQIFTYFTYKEGDNDLVEIKKVLNLFWLSLFTGRFDSHQNQNAIENSVWLYKFIFNNDQDVKSIFENLNNKKLLNVEEFATKEMLTTKKCNQSIENNIFNYIRSCNAKFLDWDVPASSTNINIDTAVDIHHIIPLNEDTKVGQSTRDIRKENNHYLNATMNKTIISSDANKKIGAKSVTKYHNDLKQYSTQFAYHFINLNWAQVDLANQDHIKVLFESRYEEILQSLKTTIYSSLF